MKVKTPLDRPAGLGTTKLPPRVAGGPSAAQAKKDAATSADAKDAKDKTSARNGLAPSAPPAGAPTFEPLTKLPPVPLTPASEDVLPEAQGVIQGWWRQLTDAIGGSAATSEINRARKVTAEVRALEPQMRALSDAELRAQTGHFKEAIQEQTKGPREALQNANDALAKAAPEQRAAARKEVRRLEQALFKAEQKVLDAILPEAFATVREAARRATGMFHYEVQTMAGALMHRGMVAEMYTGEGKTLAATMPAYLNALAGHGFHVVTVNDYLARRDAEEMGDIYRYLGLSVGFLQNNSHQFQIDAYKEGEAPDAKKPRPVSRQEAYLADVTYGTASEFAFDYLRDNGIRDSSQKSQRALWGVLLDEVDSLLIDEARIPHIIADKGEPPDVEKLNYFKELVSMLDWKTDVEWDAEEHWVSLTEAGQNKVAEWLGSKNLYDASSSDDLAYLNNALRAAFLMHKGGEYEVIDGEVRTVGLSGHAYAGRRYTHGLHQAIEAKEGVTVRPDDTTKAAITMREFLAMYQKRAGMTGTAMSAKDLFRQIYNFDVARVPTRKKLIRVDHPDKIFKTQEEKTKAFLDDVAKAHETGRPILIGCEYTHTAEWLGKLIAERGLKVRVLCAKSDAEEADIIANAGRVGAITVATARGGRGVDIKLGGNAKLIAAQLMKDEKLDKAAADKRGVEVAAEERAKVLAEGGLLVMGFEHFDSRRRDDQLRGRSGRQGDPGSTAFYSAIEDPLYDGYSTAEDIRKGKKDFDAEAAAKITERALDRSENQVNDALVQSLPYDQVLSEHRTRFYDMRMDVLEVEDGRYFITSVISNALDDMFGKLGEDGAKLKSIDDARALYKDLGLILPLPVSDPPPSWTNDKTLGQIRADVDQLVTALLKKRDESVGEELSRVLERDALITTMDDIWCSFLDEAMDLRSGIGYRAYAQKDPKLEYITETARLWKEMIGEIQAQTAEKLLKKIPVLPSQETPEESKPAAAEKPAADKP